MNIPYNSLGKKIIPFVFVILLAYIIDTILYFILPANAPIVSQNNKHVLTYKRYNINNAYKKEKTIIKKEKIMVKKVQNYELLENIELLAIYDMGSNNGFIIIKENNKNDTVILENGEKFKEYTLNEIHKSYVVFTNNANKEYKLSISDKSDLKYEVNTIKKNVKTTKLIVVNDDQVSIKRSLVNNYIENFDKIWDDIAISPIKDKKNINGFIINKINKQSAFYKIGLKKGDIIKSINNVELKSYNDAFSIYKKINTISNLNIKILRGNNEMEIFYEIN